MFPIQQRLPLRHLPDFFRRADRKYTPSFSIFWLKIAPTLPAQAAVITSKSATFKAVQRNTMKRQVRALLSPLLKNFSGIGIAVQIKKVLSPEEKTTLIQEVTKILERMK
jgi:ribonuclease P protein component